MFVLHSYDASLSWTAAVSAGIEGVFAGSGLAIDVETDYLHARRHPQAEMLGRATELAREHFERFGPHLLLACDNAAFEAALAWRGDRGPQVPIVFCGVNSFDPAILQGQRNVTGVPEEVSATDTLRLALELHPQAERIVVIGRTSVAADAANRAAFQAALAPLQLPVPVEFWDDLGPAELEQRLAELTRRTIVFVNGLLADPEGREMMYADTTAFIRARTEAPLYSLWDVYLGYGIVGGRLVSGRRQGELAARIALRVLRGEPPASIPLVSAAEANQYMFDARELARHGIPRRRLPKGSILVHDPWGNLRRYLWLIIVASLALAAESVVIAVLIGSLRLLRRTQEALRENEERLSLALTGADLGVWDWEVPSGRVAFSERWARMLGYEPEELEPHYESWARLVHPEDRERVQRELEAHLEGRTPLFEAEHRLRHKDGHWVWVLTRGRVTERDEHGRALRACGTHLDITERVLAQEQRLELERQLQHAQKLESLGLLAGGIAHDFNNLLTAIIGNLELAAADLPHAGPAAEGVNEAAEAARKAARLARQMLAYSGKASLALRVVDLNDLVRDMAALLRSSISRHLSLELRLAPESLPVEGDPSQLEQIVLNLVTNAAEAIGDASGTITLTTTARHCDEQSFTATHTQEKPPPGEYASILVSDTGGGMDAETRARLFEPYFSTKGPGRGLGMAAVLGIVRSHRGAVIVESELGRGTAVEILLPLSRKPASEEPAHEARPEPPAESRAMNGWVLVVDDEEPIRRVAAKMLERLGFRVQTASGAEEALERFREHAGDFVLVVLDLTMPRRGGAEVFRDMQAIKPDVRVILSSGYDEQEVMRRFADSLAHEGPAGFLQKPYRFDALQREVQRALAG